MPPPPPAVPAARKAKQPVGAAARTAAIVGLVGAALAAIGSFIPWFGMYGKITIALAILAVVFFIVGIVVQPRWAFVVGLILAIIFTAIFVFDMFRIILVTRGHGIDNVVFGIFPGVAGGVIAAVGAIMGIAARRV